MFRVFLADDEPWVLITLKNLIDWGNEGFIICGEATDGVKAWERIRTLEPDLILSDIQMPGLTGIELLQKIREENLNAQVVFISGYSDFKYAQAAIRYGCSNYLLKPIDEEELLKALHAVRQRAAGRQTPDSAEEEAPTSSYVSEARLAEEMLRFMQENYNSVTQQQVADQYHLSPSSVSQIIKRQTGKTYSEHLLDLRIRRAQELLRTTQDSIESIAGQVGYNDYFYFVKVFKKATGLSPSRFRRNL